jgi:5-methyltetrahydrofolate--homocysteine methyltransferase
VAAPRKPDIERRRREKVLLLDGAMGTAVMAAGLSADDYHGHDGCHDYLVLSRPDLVSGIHASYLEAGCDIIETDSFGAQAGELAKHGLQERTYEINRAAAALAVKAAGDFSASGQPRYAAGSIGPGSRLPSLEQVDFSALEESYYAQALGLLDGGVDMFQVETCQDMLQAKAALRALNRAFRERRCRRPVSLLVTLEKNRMLLGTDIATALATFRPFPLFAFGVNCGSGPEGMAEAVRDLAAASPFPLAVMPNAGLPKFRGGKYVYDLDPAPFARSLRAFVEQDGAAMVGGCCGTTARHIRALARLVGGASPAPRGRKAQRGQATSLFAVQELRVRPAPLIIGEQTNATGSRRFKAALLADDLDAMLAVAQDQAREGAHLLDLNVAYAGRDEARDMARAASRLNARSRLPLMLDSASIPALEAGLKGCAGRPVINSINLEDGGTRAGAILALARDFGAAVVCLAIDEQGMARDRARKASVLKRLHDLAIGSGLRSEDVFLDPLTFTLASGDPGLAAAGAETLAALPLLKKAMPRAHTLLGVSNISYGLLPAARRIVNAVFLYHAVRAGLDAAIFHAGRVLPLNRIDPVEIRLAEDLIFNRCQGGRRPLRAIMDYFQGKKGEEPPEKAGKTMTPAERLRAAVLNGNAAGLESDIDLLAAGTAPLDIVNGHLLKAMAEVGELFEKGMMQLPFVLQAAEVVKAALDILEPRLPKAGRRLRGSMVLATVKGDVHDIGKNLVDIILRSNGYRVSNIGTNQGGEEIAAAVKKHRPGHVGLSALLVRSTLEMEGILRHLRREGIRVPVICGGAALTPGFVASALKPAYGNNVAYAADAFAAMKIMAGIAPPGPKTAGAVLKAKAAATGIAPARPLEPPFLGSRIVRWTLEEILPFMDKRVLVKARWRMRPGAQAEEFFAGTLATIQERGIDAFSAVYGYFACRRSGRNGIVLASGAEQAVFEFPRRENISLADYFPPENDVAPLFIVSCGQALARLERELFASDQYNRYLLLHGFGVELAEALAAAMHARIRRELHLGARRGKRFSPGFPAWPELADQRLIVRLLAAGRIGVTLSAGDQLLPELSTSAMVVGHPQAAYF